jgi:hypothetical protein
MKFGYIVLLLASAAWARTDDIAKLERTSFGKVLLNTVAIQLSMNSQVGKVIGLLQDLKVGLQEEQAEHQERHDKYQREALAAIAEYDFEISKANSDLASAVKDLETYIPLRDQAIQDLLDAKAHLASLEDDKADAIAQRKIERQEFEIRVAEHDAALEAADEAAELVSKLNSNQAVLQKPVLAQIASQMKSVRHVAPSHAALLKVLVQISTSKHASADLVQSCLGLIEKLRASLEASKKKDADNEAATQAAFDAYIVEVDKNIADTEAKIADLEVLSADYKNRVIDAQLRKKDAEERIATNTELRNDREFARVVEDQEYNAQTARR